MFRGHIVDNLPNQLFTLQREAPNNLRLVNVGSVELAVPIGLTALRLYKLYGFADIVYGLLFWI